jgi:hypothetical protein
MPTWPQLRRSAAAERNADLALPRRKTRAPRHTIQDENVFDLPHPSTWRTLLDGELSSAISRGLNAGRRSRVAREVQRPGELLFGDGECAEAHFKLVGDLLGGDRSSSAEEAADASHGDDRSGGPGLRPAVTHEPSRAASASICHADRAYARPTRRVHDEAARMAARAPGPWWSFSECDRVLTARI